MVILLWNTPSLNTSYNQFTQQVSTEHNEIKMQERTSNISNKLFSSTMNNKLGVAFHEMYFFGNMSDACFLYS